MSSTFWQSILVSPAIFGAALLLSTNAIAAPNLNGSNSPLKLQDNSPIAANEPSATESDVDTVTSNTVNPGDWQYTALQGMATKYGCSTKLDDAPVSKIEFARGLNSCLAKIEPLLAQQSVPPAPGAPTSTVTQEDVEVLRRLTQEFRAQLTEIDAKIAQANQKVEAVKKNQFSTTTKLKGEAVFNLTGTLSGGNPNTVVFGDRVRLLFESSFSGKDKLWTRLATGNQPGLSGTLTNGATGEGVQVAEGGLNNTVGLDWLAYQFPFENTNVYLAAFNGIHVDYAPSFAPYFDDFTGASGALSFFAESSPIYKIGGGAGIATTLPISDSGITGLTVGYFSSTANNSAQGNGLFGGDTSIFTQANFKFGPQLEGGLTYVNSNHSGTNAIFGFGGSGALTGTSPANQNLNGTTANSYGLQLAYKASDKLSLNGFVLNTKAQKTGIGSQDIWSYGGGIALPDVDGKGGLVGLFVGAEPYVGGLGSTPLHIEGFYKYKLSDNLSITPGLIYLTAPNQVNGNAGVIGTLRTTFLF
jgi:hypothetical protein